MGNKNFIFAVIEDLRKIVQLLKLITRGQVTNLHLIINERTNTFLSNVTGLHQWIERGITSHVIYEINKNVNSKYLSTSS